MPHASGRKKPVQPSSAWDESKRFIRQDAAAERWDVSVDTIRRLIRDGKLTGYRLNSRIIRVDLDEVDACFRPIPTTGR